MRSGCGGAWTFPPPCDFDSSNHESYLTGLSRKQIPRLLFRSFELDFLEVMLESLFSQAFCFYLFIFPFQILLYFSITVYHPMPSCTSIHPLPFHNYHAVLCIHEFFLFFPFLLHTPPPANSPTHPPEASACSLKWALEDALVWQMWEPLPGSSAVQETSKPAYYTLRFTLGRCLWHIMYRMC